MRLSVETLKICPQLVGIKPKPLLRKFNDQKKENHKNLPCVLKNLVRSKEKIYYIFIESLK
jgi:hypothetical protein